MEQGFVLAAFNAAVLFFLAAVHFYWLFGGRWALDAAIPTDSNGRKLFRPGPVATLAVALGLLAFALCNMDVAGRLDIGFAQSHVRYAVLLIAVIFLLRAVGDFRYIGLTKSRRQSRFADLDTWCYTPLCLVLAASHLILYSLG